MANTGRPTKYSEDLAITICERLIDGRSLRSVCRDEDMPAASTVFRWLSEKESFREQYARAKQEAADAMAEELLDIADDGTNDWMERLDKDGKSIGWQLNGEHVQRSKLRADTRKWLMAKMKPKKYGDFKQIEEKSEVTHKFEEMTDEQLDKAIEAAEDSQA